MNEETTTYESPQVEIVLVEVERGFAGSGTAIDGSSYNESVDNAGSGTYPW